MKQIFIANNPIVNNSKKATGKFVNIDNEKFYEIENFDAMQAFFISLASESNHWLYISSTGGLTAGRKSPEWALFPYYTDDKITDGHDTTGSKTILHVEKEGKTYLWEPFSIRFANLYNTTRSIAKSTVGNKLIFSETNHDLGLVYSYMWTTSDKFGFIKKASIANLSNQPIKLNVLDGLQNLLPSGVDRQTQNVYSTLVDGYKKTEQVENSALALLRMEAILVDRAEPSESLTANAVWSCGLPVDKLLLSSAQLDNFRYGNEIEHEHEAKGVRGAYFVNADIELQANASKTWYFVAELNFDAPKVLTLLQNIQSNTAIEDDIEVDIAAGTQALYNIMVQVDGVQHTSDENGMARHFANVLFNTMRGGIYQNEYSIDSADFVRHVQHFNKKVADNNKQFLQSLQSKVLFHELEMLVVMSNDAQLLRLFQEYLPLTFSRRHGDPSRPWNLFNINVKDEAGNKILSYQGNWRDIFQNWEALSLAYPDFINNIIAKFLNATTVDGYNPYKITHEGIDWETIEPDNPWSNIGYWGDHQMIYLLKLLELSFKHNPEKLLGQMTHGKFAFANVPYRIKSYAEIVINPKDSIHFDHDKHEQILELEKTYGADARLVLNANNDVLLLSFSDKILATFLAKMSNFVPEAGIWMNTLRPEWNDANNALVGSGVSMVTLYYMRRFAQFMSDMYAQNTNKKYCLSADMHKFATDIVQILKAFEGHLNKGFDAQSRRQMTDALGKAGEQYRNKAYAALSTDGKDMTQQEIVELAQLCLAFIDQSIAANKRPDNLYHAYNLISFKNDALEIRHLYEMLEGQVAVLSSGKLSASETVQLLDALRHSALYRPDQNSYVLYPIKTLPTFLEKNTFLKSDASNAELIDKLLAKGNGRIIVQDNEGQLHFNASFNNASFLSAELKKHKNILKLSDADIKQMEDLYEKVFDHQSFTGRSGTFYKYEGLGSIYWHMVSKLLLAVGENIVAAHKNNVDTATIAALKKHYFEIKAGIGAHKAPADYGSFPFDPYSHTPLMAGVQQPGMTGQVKEDIISRFMELGIEIVNGKIVFNKYLINELDFIANADAPYLQFSYCATPIKYVKNNLNSIEITYNNGTSKSIAALEIDAATSQQIFGRTKAISQIIVNC